MNLSILEASIKKLQNEGKEEKAKELQELLTNIRNTEEKIGKQLEAVRKVRKHKPCCRRERK